MPPRPTELQRFEEVVVDEFVEALTGLLSGRYRILESHVLGRPVAARLQRPSGPGRWKTVARWGNLGVLLPWPRRHRVVQNNQGV